MTAPRVAFVASDRKGGGRVRSFWPASELERRGWVASAAVVPPQPGAADVVVVHRPLDPSVATLIEVHQRAGAVVLVDEDDDLGCVPLSNPWRPTREMLGAHDAAVAAADGVVVTTGVLRRRYGRLARRCWVIPNRLPGWVGKVRSHVRDGVVRVGWAGVVDVHRDDLEWVAPVLADAVGSATLVLVGDERALRVAKANRVRHELYGWQHTPEDLYRKMASADVGIVPLVPGRFNEAKSHLKALEFMSLGVPVVAADLPEQRALITDGVDGFLASTPEVFGERVARLVGDVGLRTQMGVCARGRARELRLESTGGDWERVLRAAWRGRSRNRPGPGKYDADRCFGGDGPLYVGTS